MGNQAKPWSKVDLGYLLDEIIRGGKPTQIAERTAARIGRTKAQAFEMLVNIHNGPLERLRNEFSGEATNGSSGSNDH